MKADVSSRGDVMQRRKRDAVPKLEPSTQQLTLEQPSEPNHTKIRTKGSDGVIKGAARRKPELES